MYNKEVLLELKHVTKHYKLNSQFFSGNVSQVLAVDDVSCKIRRNAIFGIVGESGSGKSTLMRLLVGAEKPSTGSIVYQNDLLLENATKLELKRYQSIVKMIFQDPARSLNHRLTVGRILSESLWYSWLFAQECKTLGLLTTQAKQHEMYKRIENTLLLVGLSNTILGRYPTEFSGGQRQRIAIVRALIHNPEILICDEITTALDASTRRDIINLLLQYKKVKNITIIFIAHDLSLVLYLCDEVMVMRDGKVQEISSALDLLHTPKSRATKLLLDAVPIFPRKRFV